MTIDLKELFGIDTTLNERMVTAILKAIKDGQSEGFDYLRFKHSVKSMQAMEIDAITGMKSTLTTASTMGMNKDKLLASIDHYQRIINKERESFAQALKNQMANQIDAPLQEKADAIKGIEDRKLKIAQLEREIEALTQKTTRLDQEVDQAKGKIEQTKVDFLSVYDEFTKKLSDDKSVIEQHL